MRLSVHTCKKKGGRRGEEDVLREQAGERGEQQNARDMKTRKDCLEKGEDQREGPGRVGICKDRGSGETN